MFVVNEHFFHNRLDASLRELVTVAITNATENRYIYPGNDVQTSTLMYISAFMKAHNPSNSDLEQRRYSQELADFLIDCNLSVALQESHARKESLGENWTEAEEEEFQELCKRFDRVFSIPDISFS